MLWGWRSWLEVSTMVGPLNTMSPFDILSLRLPSTHDPIRVSQELLAR